MNFDNIKNALLTLKIPYKVNTKLVRGLDYYNGMTYEFNYYETTCLGFVFLTFLNCFTNKNDEKSI
mgnify:CR=1 FL=1